MTTDRPEPTEVNFVNREALEELAWAIEASAGNFALLLARCNYASLRDQLVAELQKQFSDLRVLTVPPDTTTLFATIRDELGGEQPSVLNIFGLESVTTLDPLLSSTNQVREEFRKSFPFPLVFWVTDEVLQRLTRLAPDFESWATTTDFTFDTATLTRSLHEGADHLFETLLTPDSNLSFNRLLRQLNFGQLRLAELSAALRELQQRGETLAPEIRASLEFFQGVMNPDRTAAIESFQSSLALWESQMQAASDSETNQSNTRISPDLKAGLLRFYIGQFLYYRVYRDDERSTDWETTRQYLTQAIALFDQANRPDLAAKCTIHLQRVLERIGAWTELDALARRSLGLYQTYGTLSRLIQNYRYLAVAAIHRQDWHVACEYAQQAWERLAEVPEDQHWQGLYLLTRAKAQLGLGDRDQAIRLLEEAHQLGDQGHPQVYTEVLEELRQIYRSLHRYLEAFRLKQERQSIEQQYGIRAFVGAGRLQPKREDREALAQPLRLAPNQDEIALEIRASGRQRDLEQLLERIGRNDYKLIVIHGYSGVGKSSLVNAGLVAALKQKPIALRRNLPIVMRTYTDWEGELGRLLEEATAGWGDGFDISSAERGEGVSRERQSNEDGVSRERQSNGSVLDHLRRIEGQNRRSVLIFDQFEEFFFVYPQPEQRRSFFQFLAQCLQILSVKVVLALREDYLHFLLECHQLPEMEQTGIDILGRNVRYGLGNFAPTDAAAIIDNLTNRARFYLEPELRDALVADLAGELGQVRPIELQIVGAQLQADNITTLANYRQLGDNPKQMLVERYLAEVVNDCGEEHSRLAELVLYLLTDEKGTRPLKTRTDLEKELQALAMQPEPEQLNLVLKILVGSGPVMFLPEVPEDRYQLVHDYLAAFIREQQEPRLSALMAELEQEREQRRLAEAQRQETLLELEQAQQNLETVNLTAQQREKTARVRERIGVGVLATTLVLSGVAGAWAVKTAWDSDYKVSSANQKVTDANRKVDEKTQQADQTVKEAQTRLATANLRVKRADQELAQAKQELAGIDRQAKERIQAATQKVKEAEAKATEARQQRAKAQQAVEVAQREIALKKVEFKKLNDEFIQAKNQINLAQQAIAESIGAVPATIAQQTGVKPAIIYVSFIRSGQEASAEDTLGLLMVTETGQRRVMIAGATRQTVLKTAKFFVGEVADPRKVRTENYLFPAQQLYQWMISPLEAELTNQRITNLAFIIEDPTLRAIPLAALHNDQQFLVEKYSISTMPGLFLIGNRPSNLRNASVLALGVSEFEELNPLPSVPKELGTIAELWKNTTILLNKNATLKNLQNQRRQNAAQIIHLATHGEFIAGNYPNSFIQLWDGKLRPKDIEEFGLDNPPLELLVLSVDASTLGDDAYRFGFATAAIQAGARSVLGSLYYISDRGAMALMAEFYAQLKTAPIKAEALRQTQIAMLRGEVRIEEGQLFGVTGLGRTSLPPESIGSTSQTFSHPYYWAGFTIIGNPW